MIQQLSILHPDGVTPLQVPYIEYDLSPTERVGVIGINYDKYSKDPIPEHPEVKMTTPGKLNGEVLAAEEITHIQNSLRRDDWDFVNYPDPELVIITQKTLEEVLASEYPVNKDIDSYDVTSGHVAILNLWDKNGPSAYPGAKTLWPETPNWESIINALIKWSKEHKIPFDDILNYTLICQEGEAYFFYHIPKQICEWAYDKFKKSFEDSRTIEEIVQSFPTRDNGFSEEFKEI